MGGKRLPDGNLTMKTSTKENLATSCGAARKAHFAAGGTVAQWQGAARTFADRKHAANKTACRGHRARYEG